jgi:hypothetical protein
MTMSRILCLQLAIKEMTSPLIVPQFLPTHHASTIQETGNLGLLCQTCFQFLYQPVQLTAITDGSRNHHPTIYTFLTFLQMPLTLGLGFPTMERINR